MPPFHVIFTFAVLAMLVFAFGRVQVRRWRGRETRTRLASQPIIYREQVRARVRGTAGAWVDIKGGPAGIRMTVRTGSVDVELGAPFRRLGVFLGCDYHFDARDLTMHRERTGWAGLPVLTWDAIVLTSSDGAGRTVIGVHPRSGIAQALAALAAAGVHPG